MDHEKKLHLFLSILMARKPYQINIKVNFNGITHDSSPVWPSWAKAGYPCRNTNNLFGKIQKELHTNRTASRFYHLLKNI